MLIVDHTEDVRMALVVLLRGVNVGGHRSFRPNLLADALRRFDVVNIGAAGTLVVRHPGMRQAFRAALLRALPAETKVAYCEGRELLRLEDDDPFDGEPVTPGAVRFMSVLTRRSRRRPTLPVALPTAEDWLVRVTASRGRLVFGEYRRHMRTITHLGRIDELFGAPATTRSWSTILKVVAVLHDPRSD